MVAKIDSRMLPNQFLSFKKEAINKPGAQPIVNWELQGFKVQKKNIFLAVNPLAVCVYDTYKYLEGMGMRNVPLTQLIVPLSEQDAQRNLPKLVDRHNEYLEHFGLAVAAYWRAKAQRMLRLDPTRKVMERKLDMQIEANEVSNFREIIHSCLNISGWNPTTKLLTGGDIELLYPNAEGMLSLGTARQAVIEIDDDEADQISDSADSADEQGDILVGSQTENNVPVYINAPGNIEPPGSVAVGMWGAL